MKSFNGKVAAITGAASGMGRTLALQLAKDGCHVSISDVDTKGLAISIGQSSRHPGGEQRLVLRAPSRARLARVGLCVFVWSSLARNDSLLMTAQILLCKGDDDSFIGTGVISDCF